VFIHAGKLTDVSLASTNQIVDAEISHAPRQYDYVELEDKEWLNPNVILILKSSKR